MRIVLAFAFLAMALGGCTQIMISNNTGPVTVNLTASIMGNMATVPVSALPGVP